MLEEISAGPERLWKVAVDAPLISALTYQSNTEFHRGQRVWVPLGKRRVSGVILGTAEKSENESFQIKSILEADNDFPELSENYLRWLEWLSHYYVHPIGQVVELAYPSLRRTERTRGSRKKSALPEVELKAKHPPNEEQRTVIADIQAKAGFSVHLLFGVTGSGKTEVYLELLEKALAEGKSGLVLVPEISLTPQLLRRFTERFGDQIATLHSQLTDRERTEQWWSIFEGKKKILIGARSALFCPIPNLGLIVVDEEHESSFKQEEKLKYHARDAAIMLGKECGCPVVLGSATPSLESWKNAQEGKFHLHTLKKRVNSQPLPHVTIIDLRTAEKLPHLPGWMSAPLYRELDAHLQAGYQSALFLNRRGFSSSVVCMGCGDSPLCPDCDIHLTLHGRKHLVCHYCGFSRPYQEDCSSCDGAVLPVGLGTEQVEEDLKKIFPQARIARADRDEIQTREALESMVNKMESGETDILVGTQMIAKGFDFPKLRFAGLVLADIGFNLPDFRSTERSFQLLTQMSGRAGRHGATAEDPGKVLIQTYNPDHPSIQYAPLGDYSGFAAEELQHRAQLFYPPYRRLAVVRVQGTQRDRVWRDANQIQSWIKSSLQASTQAGKFEILGPAEAPLARLRRAFRFHILLKADSAKALEWISKQILDRKQQLSPGTKVSIDIDPLHLL